MIYYLTKHYDNCKQSNDSNQKQKIKDEVWKKFSIKLLLKLFILYYFRLINLYRWIYIYRYIINYY